MSAQMTLSRTVSEASTLVQTHTTSTERAMSPLVGPVPTIDGLDALRAVGAVGQLTVPKPALLPPAAKATQAKPFVAVQGPFEAAHTLEAQLSSSVKPTNPSAISARALVAAKQSTAWFVGGIVGGGIVGAAVGTQVGGAQAAVAAIGLGVGVPFLGFASKYVGAGRASQSSNGAGNVGRLSNKP
jgi:hypothetical protein